MATGRERVAAFVEGYGRTWESWDIPGFVDLFSDEVVYVAHATEETVVGRTALSSYIRKEAVEQGQVSVRMGTPVIDGDRVAAEFWGYGDERESRRDDRRVLDRAPRAGRAM